MIRPRLALSVCLFLPLALLLNACDRFGFRESYRIQLEAPSTEPTTTDIEWTITTILEAENYVCRGALSVQSAKYLNTAYWHSCEKPNEKLWVGFQILDDGIQYVLSTGYLATFERAPDFGGAEEALRASLKAAGFVYVPE